MNKVPTLHITPTKQHKQSALIGQNNSELHTFRQKNQLSVTEQFSSLVHRVLDPEKLAKGTHTPSLSSQNTTKTTEEKPQTKRQKAPLSPIHERILAKHKSQERITFPKEFNRNLVRRRECNVEQKMKLQQQMQAAYAKMAELQAALKVRIEQKQAALKRVKSQKAVQA